MQRSEDAKGMQTDYLLLPASHIEALPVSGEAFTYIARQAEDVRPKSTLAEYALHGWWVLANALLYAKTSAAPYKRQAELALEEAIGSESVDPDDGTGEADRLLAVVRQLPMYIFAADLIYFERSATGSRNGWTATTWEAWLTTLLTKSIGTHGRWKTIRGASDNTTNNWGAHSLCSRTALAVYLNDKNELARCLMLFRATMGERDQYAAYPHGEVPEEGSGFQTTSAFDRSWAEGYKHAIDGWRPVNPGTAIAEMSGIPVEDASRSSEPYPNLVGTGPGYVGEFQMGNLTTALLLHRQGFKPFEYGNQALRRTAEYSDAQGTVYDAFSTNRWMPYLINWLYGLGIATAPMARSRPLCYTDWLFGSSASDDRLRPS